MKNYFTVQELINSSKAKENNIDNTPSYTIKVHLNELIYSLLNPIRELWGSPVLISSGYRCPKLNKLVNGSSTSAHMTGYAADLVPANGKRAEFIKFVQDLLRNNDIPFDQCINEYDRWCHVGLKNSSGKQRRQIFKIS